MSGEGGTQKTSSQPKGQSPSLRNYAIAPSPKPIKEMMITTTLTSIQEAQSTDENSVTSLRYRGALGIGIERDLHFKPTPLSQLRRCEN